ncbi:hypothetical protein BC567DRAFT_260935 [Phyllosticta citribraziliensis]
MGYQGPYRDPKTVFIPVPADYVYGYGDEWQNPQERPLTSQSATNLLPKPPPSIKAPQPTPTSKNSDRRANEVDSLGSPPAKRPRIEDFEDPDDYVVKDARPSELAKIESLEKVERTSGADIDTIQSALAAHMMLMLLAHFKKLVAKGEDCASI